jgi:hypothetical protein
MLVTMQNPELIGKLVALAGGNVDLVQQAIRIIANGRDGADLEQVVRYIVEHRRKDSDTAAIPSDEARVA